MLAYFKHKVNFLAPSINLSILFISSDEGMSEVQLTEKQKKNTIRKRTKGT